MQIPDDFEVRPLPVLPSGAYSLVGAKDPRGCGTCGTWWDDGIVTSITPAPSARCPFEAFHDDDEDALIVAVDELVADHGTIVVFSGETTDGRLQVLFGVDHRCAGEIAAALDEDGEALVSIEAWQILSSAALEYLP